MDVLAYSAFNRRKQLELEIEQKRTCLTQIDDASRNAATSPATVCWLKCIEPCLLREPYHTEYWNQIPGLSGPGVQGFKVCDSSSNFNCGICCAWTVPAGVTCARFQIWGAGGGSAGQSCCCITVSPYGATGAYASVIIPVTAGCVYTLCSGCASCCISVSNYIGRIPGCQSYVSGFGLCNFCADGGGGRLGEWMAEYGSANVCYVDYLGSTGGGASIWCGTTVCSQASTGGLIPYVASAPYYGTTTSATNPSIVYGIRGMWPKFGITCERINCSNLVVCNVHPPIYGFEKESMCQGMISNTNNYSQTRSDGIRASSGYLRIPGAGGAYGGTTFASTVGGTCFVGDRGRAGMVCVSYC